MGFSGLAEDVVPKTGPAPDWVLPRPLALTTAQRTNDIDPSAAARWLTAAHGLDTDAFIFTADETATLLLDDIRPGDVIEWAFYGQRE